MKGNKILMIKKSLDKAAQILNMFFPFNLHSS